MSTDLAPDTELPSTCEGCGQPLLLRAPGRTRCERCRLGHAPDQQREEPSDEAEPEREAERPPVACAGCGQTETEWNNRRALADGYCLPCRLDGKHLGA
ncbi:hypothetical protein GCM10023321_53140 [Pseudonocardia eucalypti]|uniref:Small CPxCG-related zinc finger protein n=1 Tax=Pseudonocardia eucalypti TaxID=648755 RepID=A0ABP9QMU3_9PSEU|nr:pyruvate/2-oxoacid:ferredoxin oxidoreductase beta subunit [Pseudonocardia eucalypti]